MNRRTLLSALGSAAAVGAAGCLSGGDGPDAAGTAPPTDESTDTPSVTPTSTRPRTDATSPDVTTPAPGECEATAPPYPDSYEGLPDPKPYPAKPDAIEPDQVDQFLRDYENAYRFNTVLADLVAEGACITYLDAPVEESSVSTASDGVVGSVETRWSFTGDTCPDATGTDTQTPLPHADGMVKRARYYVTDRFLIREGVVVACWA